MKSKKKSTDLVKKKHFFTIFVFNKKFEGFALVFFMSTIKNTFVTIMLQADTIQLYFTLLTQQSKKKIKHEVKEKYSKNIKYNKSRQKLC